MNQRTHKLSTEGFTTIAPLSEITEKPVMDLLTSLEKIFDKISERNSDYYEEIANVLSKENLALIEKVDLTQLLVIGKTRYSLFSMLIYFIQKEADLRVAKTSSIANKSGHDALNGDRYPLAGLLQLMLNNLKEHHPDTILDLDQTSRRDLTDGEFWVCVFYQTIALLSTYSKQVKNNTDDNAELFKQLSQTIINILKHNMEKVVKLRKDVKQSEEVKDTIDEAPNYEITRNFKECAKALDPLDALNYIVEFKEFLHENKIVFFASCFNKHYDSLREAIPSDNMKDSERADKIEQLKALFKTVKPEILNDDFTRDIIVAGEMQNKSISVFALIWTISSYTQDWRCLQEYLDRAVNISVDLNERCDKSLKDLTKGQGIYLLEMAEQCSGSQPDFQMHDEMIAVMEQIARVSRVNYSKTLLEISLTKTNAEEYLKVFNRIFDSFASLLANCKELSALPTVVALLVEYLERHTANVYLKSTATDVIKLINAIDLVNSTNPVDVKHLNNIAKLTKLLIENNLSRWDESAKTGFTIALLVPLNDMMQGRDTVFSSRLLNAYQHQCVKELIIYLSKDFNVKFNLNSYYIDCNGKISSESDLVKMVKGKHWEIINAFIDSLNESELIVGLQKILEQRETILDIENKFKNVLGDIRETIVFSQDPPGEKKKDPTENDGQENIDERYTRWQEYLNKMEMEVEKEIEANEKFLKHIEDKLNSFSLGHKGIHDNGITTTNEYKAASDQPESDIMRIVKKIQEYNQTFSDNDKLKKSIEACQNISKDIKKEFSAAKKELTRLINLRSTIKSLNVPSTSKSTEKTLKDTVKDHFPGIVVEPVKFENQTATITLKFDKKASYTDKYKKVLKGPQTQSQQLVKSKQLVIKFNETHEIFEVIITGNEKVAKTFLAQHGKFFKPIMDEITKSQNNKDSKSTERVESKQPNLTALSTNDKPRELSEGQQKTWCEALERITQKSNEITFTWHQKQVEKGKELPAHFKMEMSGDAAKNTKLFNLIASNLKALDSDIKYAVVAADHKTMTIKIVPYDLGLPDMLIKNLSSVVKKKILEISKPSDQTITNQELPKVEESTRTPQGNLQSEKNSVPQKKKSQLEVVQLTKIGGSVELKKEDGSEPKQMTGSVLEQLTIFKKSEEPVKTRILTTDEIKEFLMDVGSKAGITAMESLLGNNLNQEGQKKATSYRCKVDDSAGLMNLGMPSVENAQNQPASTNQEKQDKETPTVFIKRSEFFSILEQVFNESLGIYTFQKLEPNQILSEGVIYLSEEESDDGEETNKVDVSKEKVSKTKKLIYTVIPYGHGSSIAKKGVVPLAGLNKMKDFTQDKLVEFVMKNKQACFTKLLELIFPNQPRQDVYLRMSLDTNILSVKLDEETLTQYREVIRERFKARMLAYIIGYDNKALPIVGEVDDQQILLPGDKKKQIDWTKFATNFSNDRLQNIQLHVDTLQDLDIAFIKAPIKDDEDKDAKLNTLLNHVFQLHMMRLLETTAGSNFGSLQTSGDFSPGTLGRLWNGWRNVARHHYEKVGQLKFILIFKQFISCFDQHSTLSFFKKNAAGHYQDKMENFHQYLREVSQNLPQEAQQMIQESLNSSSAVTVLPHNAPQKLSKTKRKERILELKSQCDEYKASLAYLETLTDKEMKETWRRDAFIMLHAKYEHAVTQLKGIDKENAHSYSYLTTVKCYRTVGHDSMETSYEVYAKQLSSNLGFMPEQIAKNTMKATK